MLSKEEAVICCIHVHLDQLVHLNLESLSALLDQFAADNSHFISRHWCKSDLTAEYANFFFEVLSTQTFSDSLKERVRSSTAPWVEVKDTSIVVCQGHDGWNDYSIELNRGE